MKKVFMFVLVVMLGVSFMGVSSVVAGDCGPVGTGTPGYWKNHPDAWPVDAICFDGIQTPCVPKVQALYYLNSPVRKDKWITLFKAYAAAYLNVKNGNCRPYCEYITPGDINLDSVASWLVNNRTSRPVRANTDEWQYSHGELQYWCLDDYNNGLLPGIPSRDTLE